MNEQPEPFPWQKVMQFGFGVLRLSPRQFWSLSLRELQSALEVHYPSSEKPVSRQWLDTAINKYPDKKDYAGQ